MTLDAIYKANKLTNEMYTEQQYLRALHAHM